MAEDKRVTGARNAITSPCITVFLGPPYKCFFFTPISGVISPYLSLVNMAHPKCLHVFFGGCWCWGPIFASHVHGFGRKKDPWKKTWTVILFMEEIRHPPVEFGSLSHPRCLAGFLPSTVFRDEVPWSDGMAIIKWYFAHGVYITLIFQFLTGMSMELSK